MTDAGDAVIGATVAAKGQYHKAKGSGAAKLIIGSPHSHVTVTITAPGYQTLTKLIRL